MQLGICLTAKRERVWKNFFSLPEVHKSQNHWLSLLEIRQTGSSILQKPKQHGIATAPPIQKLQVNMKSVSNAFRFSWAK
jgi:hypothetical protein